MTYWVLRVAGKLCQSLPIGVCYRMAVLLADIAWLLLPVQRENALDNMAKVLGRDRKDPEVRNKARASFRNYALYLADFLKLPALDPAEMDARLRFHGWEDLDEALSAGKGVIFISAHVGNWDLGSSVFARRGYPVNVVVDTFQPKRLNDLVLRQRTSHGVKVIPLELSARRVLGTLRKNEILGLLMDIPSPESGVLVRFFDGLTQVPAGAALLALKTGARLLSGVIVRNPDHTYSGFVNSHFEVELTGDLSEDIRLLTQQIMSTLEGFIRQYPDQWYIFRPMWPEDLGAEACS